MQLYNVIGLTKTIAADLADKSLVLHLKMCDALETHSISTCDIDKIDAELSAMMETSKRLRDVATVGEVPGVTIMQKIHEVTVCPVISLPWARDRVIADE
ncbi:hypothetical protein [Tumebacillus lipolyticus]|uniref:Uncharacterized protein n=1 Tax=Tumebacillus lipolyticus TaxID=1280370 RepID=A0ABW5A2E8_9BACL